MNLSLLEKMPVYFRFWQALRLLVSRDLQQRVTGTVLGLGWLVLNSAFLLAIYTFVFGLVLKVRFTDVGGTGEFAIYLMAALLPFLGFQEGVLRSTSVLSENRDLINKVVFPPILLPLSVVLSSIAVEIIGLAVLVAVLLWQGILTWTVLFLPILMVARLLLTVGMAWIVSVITVFLRDLSQAMALLLTILMFATPILYPASAVPEAYHWLMDLNPITILVNSYRGILIEGMVPGVAFYLLLFGALIFAALSLFFFDRMIERTKDFL
ncbi:MAG: ABC transporter permease [Candidatus Thiodiazotropha sp.]